jgi:hypothetical protein
MTTNITKSTMHDAPTYSSTVHHQTDQSTPQQSTTPTLSYQRPGRKHHRKSVDTQALTSFGMSIHHQRDPKQFFIKTSKASLTPPQEKITHTFSTA